MPEHPLSLPIFVTLAVGGLGLYLLLPRGPVSENRAVRWAGGVLTAASLFFLAASLAYAGGTWTEGFTFFTLAGTVLISGVMTITSRNPVFSALWFALVLLANSGLFLLAGAEFLAAATIIIYAGAIIVTFLFVIMLAQPRGTAPYDRYGREPLLASLAGVILAGSLVGAVHYALTVETQPESVRSNATTALPDRTLVTRTLASLGPATQNERIDSQRPHVDGLGRALFLDHYISIEVIGVLLLVAVAGAVLIVGRGSHTAPPSVPPLGGK